VRRWRKALAVAGTVALVIVLVLVLLLTVGRQMLLRRLAATGFDTSVGKLSFDEIKLDRGSITLSHPRLQHPDTGEDYISAEEVSIGASWLDMLRNLAGKQSLTVTIKGLSASIEYEGKGKWSFSDLLERLPEPKETKLETLNLRLRDSAITLKLAPAARDEINGLIDEKLNKTREAAWNKLAAWLESNEVVLAEGFAADLRSALHEPLVELQDSLRVAFAADLTVRPVKRAFDGVVQVESPVALSLKLSGQTDKASFRAEAEARGVKLDTLPFIASGEGIWDLSEATVDQLKAVVSSDGKPELKEFAAELSNIVLLPAGASRIEIGSAAGAMDSGGTAVTVDGLAGGGPFAVSLDTSGGKGLRANFNVPGIAAFVTSVAGVSAEGLQMTVEAGEPFELEKSDITADMSVAGLSRDGMLLAEGVTARLRRAGGTVHADITATQSGREFLAANLVIADSKVEGTAKITAAPSALPRSLRALHPAISRIRRADLALKGQVDVAGKRVVGRTQHALIELTDGTVSSPGVSFDLSLDAATILAPQVVFQPRWPADIALPRERLPSRVVASADLKASRTQHGWRARASSSGKAEIGDERLYFRAYGGGVPQDFTLQATLSGVVGDEPLWASLAAKTAGTEAVLALAGRYATAAVSSQGSMRVDGSKLLLGYEIKDLSLHKWLGVLPIIDPVTTSGTVSGSMHHPFLHGTAFVNRVGAEVAGRQITAYEVSAGYALEPGHMVLEKAYARIGGELLNASGWLAVDEFSLRVGDDHFSLASALDHLYPELSLPATGDGLLAVNAHGKYSAPVVACSYAQSSGSVGGEELHEFIVDAEYNGNGLTVKRGSIRLGDGSLETNGSWRLANGRSSDWNLQMDHFPVEPWARVTPALAKLGLKGGLTGEMVSLGSLETPVVQGKVSLENGAVLNTPIDEALISFNIQPDGIRVDSFQAYNEETIATASGFWSWKPEDTMIDLYIPYLDLEMLEPLVPEAFRPLSGGIGFIVAVTSDEQGHPALEGSFHSADERGISAGGIVADSVSGMLRFASGALELRDASITSSGSMLYANGVMPVPGLSDAFDLHVSAQDFALGGAQPLFPLEDVKYAGKLTCELDVAGTLSDPLVYGNAKLDLSGLGYRDMVALASLSADIDFDGRTITGKGAVLRPTNGKGGNNLARMDISRVQFAPGFRGIEAMGLELDLTGLELLEIRGLFKGGLDGTVSVNKEFREQPIVISGDIAVRSGAVVQLPTLASAAPVTGPLNAYVDLRLSVRQECWIKYRPLMMEVALHSPEAVHITGTLQQPQVSGRLDVTRGSLLVLNRIVRLTEVDEPAKIIMQPEYGLSPHLFGTAAVELPGVLRSSRGDMPVEILPSELPFAPTGEDLTIYFRFHDMPLQALMDEQNLDEIDMYSHPPLARETLLAYLLGGSGLDLTRSGMQTFIGSEALAFTGSRLSRFLEESLDFKRFELRALSSDLTGKSGTPFLLNVEKELFPGFTVNYLRTFLSEVDQREEYGAKYYLYERYGGRAFGEILWRQRGQVQEEWVANVGVSFRF
jgi:hypothetical protein